MSGGGTTPSEVGRVLVICELLVGGSRHDVESAEFGPLNDVYAMIESMTLRRTHGGRLCPVRSNHEFCICLDARGKKCCYLTGRSAVATILGRECILPENFLFTEVVIQNN